MSVMQWVTTLCSRHCLHHRFLCSPSRPGAGAAHRHSGATSGRLLPVPTRADPIQSSQKCLLWVSPDHIERQLLPHSTSSSTPNSSFLPILLPREYSTCSAIFVSLTIYCLRRMWDFFLSDFKYYPLYFCCQRKPFSTKVNIIVRAVKCWCSSAVL